MSMLNFARLIDLSLWVLNTCEWLLLSPFFMLMSFHVSTAFYFYYEFFRKALFMNLHVYPPFFGVFQDMLTVRVSGVCSLARSTPKCGVCLLCSS